MLRPHDSRQNHILAALPIKDFNYLLPHLDRVSMARGHVIYESGVPLQYIYFPANAIVSLLNIAEDGNTAEVAVVGNEGVLGVSIFMGGRSTFSRAVVHSAGDVYRLSARVLMDVFNRFVGGRASTLHDLLLRYTQMLLTQMAQTAMCNCHHSVDQKLCRQLLLNLDRAQTNELTMTQELIATTLGVRRESVTEAAGKMQKTGLIKYRRGFITVLNRSGLEARVCECYAVFRKESERLRENLLSQPLAA